jgi:serine/threonine protein kinase/Tfp pilus assembly protein PilF
MGPDLPCDESLISRLPLPLARLYLRAHNAKTPYDRHQAAYFLWEAALKLLGSVSIVSYAESGQHRPDLDSSLESLARPSVGHWWGHVRLLVPVLAEGKDEGFLGVRDLLLGPPRTDMPQVAELDFTLCEELGVSAGPRNKVRIGELFDRLVQYRNRELGHGAAGMRPDPCYYARMGRVMLSGLAELLGRLDVLAGRRLVYIAEVRLQKIGSYLIERYALAGESARRIESQERPAAEVQHLPLPEQVYVEGPGDRPPSSLRPLMTYDPQRGEVLFLNASRDRHRIEYLSYTTGDHLFLAELEGEQRELLSRLLRGPIDPITFERWKNRPTPDEPVPSSPKLTTIPPPRRIGEFELVSELGRGNMGKVYRAWQPSLGRQVALKKISGADDPKARGRFRREIRALGRVDHPNLVKIYTSGVDEDPCYYTMELVEGATLAAVCDTLHDRSSSAAGVDLDTWKASLSTACEETHKAEKALSDNGSDGLSPEHAASVRQTPPPSAQPPADQGYVRQVVELMRQVALAAHALHEAGVVHRDLKPGNIMVMPDGSQAVLMDLGLAQLADDVEGRLTRTRQFVGTLRYASPEQVLAVGGIDRRSDLYSLGATLWELLTLRPLYDATEETPTPELMRRITSSEPDRVRRYHPGIASDLEAIVHKCLEKDPHRRYATAAELAEDLARWQRGELVTAQPLTIRYVLGKFVRRHRWQIAAAAALILLLAAGLAVEFQRIKQARNLAEQQRNEAIALKNRAEGDEQQIRQINDQLQVAFKQTEEQRDEARRQRDKADAARTRAEKAEAEAKGSAANAEAINNFLVSMLSQAAPERHAREHKITVEEALDRAAEQIDKGMAFRQQRRVEAAIRDTLGNTYRSLGEYAKAEPQLRLAVGIHRAAQGPEHPDTLTAMNNLALLLLAQGKLAEAEPLYRQVVEAQTRVQGPEHPDALTSIGGLADVLRARGKLAEAEPLLRQILEARRRLLGPEHPAALTSTDDLAGVLKDRGRLAEAEPLDRQVLEARRRVLGPEHPRTLASMNNLATVLEARGKLAEAEPLYRQVVEVGHRVLGPEHPHTLTAMNNLGFLLQARGKLAEAEPLLRQALEGRRRVLEPEHPDTLASMAGLAKVLLDRRRPAEAEPFSRQVLEARRRILGPEHPVTLTAMAWLVEVLRARGKVAEAEPILRQVVEARRRLLGGEHPTTLAAMTGLAAVLQARGRPAEAEPLYRQVVEARRRLLGGEHPATLAAMAGLAKVLLDRRRPAEAEPFSRQVVEARRRILGPEHPTTLTAMVGLAAVLQARGKPAEAEPILRQVVEARRRLLGGEHPATLTAMNDLAVVLKARGKLAEAEPLLRQALEARHRVLGPEHPDTRVSMNNLALVLLDRRRPAEAEPILRQSLRVERTQPRNLPALANTLTALGRALNDNGKVREAEPLLHEAREIRRKVLPKGHWRTASTESVLGGCLTKQGRYDVAEPLLLNSYPTIASAPGMPPAQARQALERIVALYEAWGKPEQAAAWRVKLMDVDFPADPFAREASGCQGGFVRSCPVSRFQRLGTAHSKEGSDTLG